MFFGKQNVNTCHKKENANVFGHHPLKAPKKTLKENTKQCAPKCNFF